MDRPALHVLKRILNQVCEHHSMDYKYESPEYLEKALENDEFRTAYVTVVKHLLEIRTTQRNGDIRLLKAIFGEDFDSKELLKAKVVENVEEIEDGEIEDDEENECNNCEECIFKYDCDTSTYEAPYKARVAKEYWEYCDKYEKLCDYIMKVEQKKVKDFKGDIKALKRQSEQLFALIDTLQKRAVIENIPLGKYKENK